MAILTAYCAKIVPAFRCENIDGEKFAQKIGQRYKCFHRLSCPLAQPIHNSRYPVYAGQAIGDVFRCCKRSHALASRAGQY